MCMYYVGLFVYWQGSSYALLHDVAIGTPGTRVPRIYVLRGLFPMEASEADRDSFLVRASDWKAKGSTQVVGQRAVVRDATETYTRCRI